MQNPLRNIPTVGELLESPPLKALVSKISRNALANVVLATLDEIRHEAVTAAAEMTLPNATELAERIARRVAEGIVFTPRATINATGIILRNDLGGVPLADAAVASLSASARDYAHWELDIVSGKPVRRDSAIVSALRELSGAEAALILNDERVATVLACEALASGREILVSRGEITEFDGGLRLPDVIAAGHAKIREVGATAATNIQDYSVALERDDSKVAAILRAEPRDFLVSGAINRPALGELVVLARSYRVPVVHLLAAEAPFDRLPAAPTVSAVNAVESLRAGADVVILRGDGLLGGPQCGIILGRKTFIDQIAKHPFVGVAAADRLTLTALAVTLRLHREPERAAQAVPVVQLACVSKENLQNRAERLAPQIAAAKNVVLRAEPQSGVAYLRGVPLPGRELPTWRVVVTPAHGPAERLAATLRCGVPSLTCKVEADRVVIDLRSVLPRQDAEIVGAFEVAAGL